MSNRTSRKYGMPFKGYMASIDSHSCPPDYATYGSVNYLYRPSDGAFVRRDGSSNATTNCLEGLWGSSAADLSGKAKDRYLREMSSSVLPTPTYSCLYTKDVVANNGYLDDGRFGQMYFRGTAYNTDEVCGKGADAHYEGSAAAHFVCVPLWYDSGEGGLTRLTNPLARRFHCPGSRRFLDVGEWRHFPSYYGTPSKWNRKFNDGTSTTHHQEMVFPSGPIPPLWCPVVDMTATKTTASAAWKSGQRFYVSVMFQFEDGSWSMPAVPRPVSTVLTSGLGLYTIPGTVPGYPLSTDVQQYCPYIDWTIPIGPPGVVARALLRSESTQAIGTGANVDPAYDALKIVEVIKDNTTTTFRDYKGDDTALLDDPDHLYFRWDHIMPPPARYIWDFDGRTAHGYGRTSRSAIFLAPTATTSAKDLNLAIDSSSFGTGKYYVYNDGTNLILKYDTGAAVTSVSIALGSGGTGPGSVKTLQDVVDAINATTTSSLCKEWRAQIAPGAASTALASDLLTHSMTTSASCSATTGDTFVTSTGTVFANVAVGMAIKVVSGDILAGTYVKSVESSGKIHLCDHHGVAKAVESAFNNIALTFYHDLGDAQPTGDTTTYGNQRVVAGCYEGCLYFKNSHFASEPSGKSAVWMTVGGPMQVRQSANAFVSAPSNKHIPPGNPGICMGGGGLADGSVVLFANERNVLRNTRGGRTGLDEDYRLDRMSRTGCISGDGVVVGFGWVGFPSWEGFIACDVSNEMNLTRDLWDAGNAKGEIAYELRKCLGGSAADSDIGTFHASIIGNRLHLCYSTNQTTVRFCYRSVMDFGEGSQSSGLGQLVAPDGKPWGWSTPLPMIGLGSIGSVRTSSGFKVYGATTLHTGTADGRIELLDVAGSTRDAGVAFTSTLILANDFFDSLKHKSSNDTIFKFNSESGNDSLTATSIGYFDSGGSCESSAVLVPSASQMPYTVQTKQWSRAVRGKNRSIQLRIDDDGSSAIASEIWGAESSADLLDTYD